jgi:hypothetical protein
MRVSDGREAVMRRGFGQSRRGNNLFNPHRLNAIAQGRTIRPNPVEPHPEQPVCGEQPKPTWALPPQDTHLMSQRDELEFQGGGATKPEAEYGNDGGENRDHPRDGRAVAQNLQRFSVLRSFEQAQVAGRRATTA